MSQINTQPLSIDYLIDYPNIADIKYLDGIDQFLWVESVDGQGSIYQMEIRGKKTLLSNSWNVRGNLNYGGGEFDTGKTQFVFSEKSGAIIKGNVDGSGRLEKIVPPIYRTASPSISKNEEKILFVFEQDGNAGIGGVRLSRPEKVFPVIQESDFYMDPVWHPSGKSAAWVEWNHPHMPWQASCVKLGKISGNDFLLTEEVHIAGGEGCAAAQPQFSPDGKWLSYIQRDGNWDSLLIVNLESGNTECIIQGEGFHLKLPEWVQGIRTYAWGQDCRNIYCFKYRKGKTTLCQKAIHHAEDREIPIDPITWATQISASDQSNTLTFLGSSPSHPKQICNLNLKTAKLNFFLEENVPHYPEIHFRKIDFKGSQNHSIYGFYVHPLNENLFKKGKPPLILHVHGGPTSLSAFSYSKDAYYFTSRGFAFAMLNYRGSSGYGYDYQDFLFQNWGVVDVQDTRGFANYLIEAGFADENRIVLMGSSAGGYTILNTLIKFPGFFKAGICSYPVTDLVADAEDTHKFEKYYHRFLTGDLKTDYRRFVERSPINHIDEIRDPVALFHGSDDPVVDCSQSERIYQELKKRGIPCMLQIYEGEGHGFRQRENIRDFYKKTEVFLANFL